MCLVQRGMYVSESPPISTTGLHGAGICLDQPLDVAVRGCRHRLCIDCALRLCELSKKPPLCPFCRSHIEGFVGNASCARRRRLRSPEQSV